MNQRSIVTASTAALVALLAWWGGISYLDGILAGIFPYDQYATIALLYPEVFYPGIPGLFLTEALYAISFDAVFGGWTLVVGLLGWIVVLSMIIGTFATWYVSERPGSPIPVAAIAVIGVFVVFTVMEAASTLV